MSRIWRKKSRKKQWMLKINVHSEGLELPFEEITAECIRDIASRAAKILEIETGSFSLIATDDVNIRDVNRQYRELDRPTDVIAFEYRDSIFPAGPEEELGDIYISLETAKRQSEEYGVTLSEETARLIVHGILHCLGYDHETSEDDAREMAALEEDLLDKLL